MQIIKTECRAEEQQETDEHCTKMKWKKNSRGIKAASNSNAMKYHNVYNNNRPNLGTSSFNYSHKPKIKEKLNRYMCASLVLLPRAQLFAFSNSRRECDSPQSRKTKNNYLFLLLYIIITNCFNNSYSFNFLFSFFSIFVGLLFDFILIMWILSAHLSASLINLCRGTWAPGTSSSAEGNKFIAKYGV